MKIALMEFIEIVQVKSFHKKYIEEMLDCSEQLTFGIVIFYTAI